VSGTSVFPAGSSLSGSASAFDDEFDYVYRTFRRLGASPADAEDLAQDVFVVMCRRWSDFQSDRPLRAWLTGIAHRLALDHARRHRRREVATPTIEQEDEGPRPDDQLASARARQLALQALAMLSEQHRSVLVRHELDGLSIRAIGREWSIPFFTVAARLRRARLRFARAVKQLQRRGPAPEAVLSPRAILDAERSVPPASQRRRARVRAVLLQPPPPAAIGGAPPARPAARWPWTAAAAAVAVAVAGSLLWFALGLPQRSGRPARAIAAASPGPAGPRARAALARGLVGRWRFEDGPGSAVARDWSGNGRSCLLHDLDLQASWVAGPAGGALDLGRTGWLDCPMPPARAGVPVALSVGIWMKPTAQRRPQSALLVRRLSGTDVSHLFWLGVRDGFLAVWSWAWTGWTTGALPSPDAWTHVAFVHGADETRLYVNGVLVRRKLEQVPRGEGEAGSLTIGAMPVSDAAQGVRHHFDGLVDEAVVYDRVLDDAEIAALAALRQ
jgi:RNA polymerase sigma-70 factor (ECF subfamily)